jgi:uncharacterized membrane protein
MFTIMLKDSEEVTIKLLVRVPGESYKGDFEIAVRA